MTATMRSIEHVTLTDANGRPRYCPACGWHTATHEDGQCPDGPAPWSDPWDTWHRAVHLSGYWPDTAWYELGVREGWIDERTQLYIGGWVVTVVPPTRS